MQIKIHPPYALCEKGRRPRNEDTVYPAPGKADTYSQTFLVCDGVGGVAKGNVASRMVANAFGTAFEKITANPESLCEVLAKVQADIDAYMEENPDSKGMGTTLAFLQFNSRGAVIAHAGDSRVYHIRREKVLFCTSDHSLANELLKRGKVEEAKMVSGNIITRAIQGSSIKKIALDVQDIPDVQAGDYFLLCSDGVWGVLPDEKLISILSAKAKDEDKIAAIHRICAQSSNDNYSTYLIYIQEVVPDDFPASIHRAASSAADNFRSASQQNVLVENTRKTGIHWRKVMILMILLGLLGFYLWYSSFKIF